MYPKLQNTKILILFVVTLAAGTYSGEYAAGAVKGSSLLNVRIAQPTDMKKFEEQT
jgi:hypothetical protein